MFCEIKAVEFALDLDVIKTKIVSMSKKPFLVVLIALPGSFRFSEHDPISFPEAAFLLASTKDARPLG